ncbi:PREDICTED: LOW QUALITY PROTEIN: uncharacterized protein LOC109131307 [Camelina sativa]|uniref:LOW QUALITY PROTEIN: uncharacterized protein LOC109131307 n=1 Tax=Camelina sativa TaxID=90675 RepID=A0ABM1RF64_CAMSA|nr:PREDICTED: LOW QUALITY PROTEIN: uncharacterized protein LOC109131307 [Camelina sativa]
MDQREETAIEKRNVYIKETNIFGKKIRVFYKMRFDYLCFCKTELKSRNFMGGNGGGGHQSP